MKNLMHLRLPAIGLVIVAFLAITAPSALAQGQSVDVGLSAAVLSLASAGVIDGGGNVRLDDYVNRAEALKMILASQSRFSGEVAKMSSSMPPISLFADVDQRQWYAPYIEVGFSYGLVKGYGDGRFWPNGGVRMAEAASMLVRSQGLKDAGGVFLTSPDLENEQGHWYTNAVTILNQRQAALPGSRLKPADYLSRGELLYMIYRMRETAVVSATSAGTQSTVPEITTTASAAAASTVPPSLAPSSNALYLSKKDFAITIPTLGIVDLTVTHPTDPYTQKGVLAPLQDGVGHLFSYPGQGGRIMIYGHSSGYPWDLSKFTKIFRSINEVKVGAPVYVTYGGKLYVYQVTQKKTIPAKDKAPFASDENGEELVLYTCWPPDSITNRYLVYAKPVDSVAAR